jgi:hypothetical protein
LLLPVVSSVGNNAGGQTFTKPINKSVPGVRSNLVQARPSRQFRCSDDPRLWL